MKSNKLIAFFCSAAMVVTSISGIFASAKTPAADELLVSAGAIEKGYNLVFDSENSTATQKIIDVYAVGYASVKSGSISFEVPDAVASKITAVEADGEAGLFPGVTLTELDTVKSSKFLGGAFAAAKAQSSDDMLLFEINITLSEDLDSDWELVVINDATIEDASGEYFLEDDEFAVGTDTVTVWSDPSATPTPIPTDAPVEQGYKLVFDSANSTAASKIVSVYAVGYTAVKSGSISFEVPEAVASKITAVAADDEAGLFPGVTLTELDTIKSSNFLGGAFAAAKTQSSDDMLLFKLTITLSEDIEDNWYLAVINDATIEDASGEYFLEDDEFDVQSDTVTPYATTTPTTEPTTEPTEEPFVGDGEVAIKDIVKPENPDAVAGVYIKVTKNGSDAKYGTDYVATLDGKQLTEEEFENVQNGLTPDGTAYEDKVVDNIINKLVIKGVKGTTVAAAPSYSNGSGQLVTDPEDIATDNIGTTPTATPTARPTATPTARPTTRPSGGSGSGGHGGSTIASGGSTSGVAGSTVTTPAANFTDLDSVPWAVPAINTLAGNGIVNGTSATTFEPLAPVTRAQFAKMVCITFGVGEKNPATPTFTDVAPTDWFYGYVEAAAATGIVMGVSDTEFDPNALITREQMAAMMYRAITINNITLKTSGAPVSFTDAYAISDYAVEAVNALSAANVINGMDDGRFAPQETATRAQAACIIYQYFLSYTN